MKTAEIKQAIRAGALELIRGEDTLTDLDTRTGDGDHGLTMKKIADKIICFCDGQDPGTADSLFTGLAESVLQVNGGSIVSIWAEMFFGVADELGDRSVMNREDMPAVLAGAIQGIRNVSRAVPGDKTLIDTLTAVQKACDNCTGGADENYWETVVRAAESGAESTRGMIAKYGRAKQLLDGSIGFADPGAVSMFMFIRGMAGYFGGRHE